MSEIKVGKNANSEHKMITLILPFHGFMKFGIRVSLYYLAN